MPQTFILPLCPSAGLLLLHPLLSTWPHLPRAAAMELQKEGAISLPPPPPPAPGLLLPSLSRPQPPAAAAAPVTVENPCCNCVFILQPLLLFSGLFCWLLSLLPHLPTAAESGSESPRLRKKVHFCRPASSSRLVAAFLTASAAALQPEQKTQAMLESCLLDPASQLAKLWRAHQHLNVSRICPGAAGLQHHLYYLGQLTRLQCIVSLLPLAPSPMQVLMPQESTWLPEHGNDSFFSFFRIPEVHARYGRPTGWSMQIMSCTGCNPMEPDFWLVTIRILLKFGLGLSH